MLGLLCATPEELDALAALLDLRPEAERHGPTRVWRGRHDGQDLALALSGIGKVNAAAAATLLLSVFEARTLIFSGVAGGLVLADRLSAHDYGVMAAGRFTATASGIIPIGAPPLEALEPVADDVRETLARLAERVTPLASGPVRLGGIVTGDYFLNCAATRDALQSRFAADGIDMESAAVRQVADAWGAPIYVIRTLSDLAGEESHLTYPEMAATAARNSALCVPELLALLQTK